MTGDKGPFDLNDLLASERIVFQIKSVETSEDRIARLDREQDDAKHRRQVFWAVFALVVIAGAGSFSLATTIDASPETQSWLRTIASEVIAGLVGYFGGSAGKVPK